MPRRPPPPPPPDPNPLEDPTGTATAQAIEDLLLRVERIESLLVETATATRDHLRDHAAQDAAAEEVYRLPRWV